MTDDVGDRYRERPSNFLSPRPRMYLSSRSVAATYVSYLVVSAGTDLAGAILAGAASGGSHYGVSRFRFRAEPDYYLLIF